MRITLSLPEARRLAIASQGFQKRPPTASVAHLRKLATRLHAFQIDSVNVLARAHYVPAFARLGPYPMEALDDLTYRKRELFEYWGHAACLLPVSLYPLVRYRMHKHTEQTREYMRSRRGGYMAQVYAEVAERGPLTAAELSNPGKRSAGWWSWWGTGNGKATLEHLYDAGLVAIAGRRGFERRYDITSRVIPQTELDAPAPPREEAMKQLICLAAKAYGVGTLRDLAGYFHVDGWHDRLPPGPRWGRPKSTDGRRARPVVKRLVSELEEEQRLLPVRVDGWDEQAYLHPDARVPQNVDARGLVTPFDSLVWERARIERLFGMKYTIEMYLPPDKRVYGYYVCPFLLGDTLVARCDLKADRARQTLVVQGAFLEPGQKARPVAPDLAGELRQMQKWLGLDRIEVRERGDWLRRYAGASGPNRSILGADDRFPGRPQKTTTCPNRELPRKASIEHSRVRLRMLIMLLSVHIIAGGLAIVFGALALTASKGATLHRRGGLMFVYAMVTMGLSGAILALRQSLTNANVLGGIMSCYFVVTALTTVRPVSAWTRRFNSAALLVAIGLSVIDVGLGFKALASPGRAINGVPFFMPFFLATVMALAAGGDLRIMRSGELRSVARLRRHLWRMCFALFIAAGSFFSIRSRVAKILPEPFLSPAMRALPVALVFAAMFYWLWRVRSRRMAAQVR